MSTYVRPKCSNTRCFYYDSESLELCDDCLKELSDVKNKQAVLCDVCERVWVIRDKLPHEPNNVIERCGKCDREMKRRGRDYIRSGGSRLELKKLDLANKFK